MCNIEFPNDEPADTRQRFPIEKSLRNLAMIPGAYIMAVLDCCRRKLGIRPIPTRGESGSGKKQKLKNLIIFFACPPGGTASGNSHLTGDLLYELRDRVDSDNSLVLPVKLIDWEMPDEGEVMVKSA